MIAGWGAHAHVLAYQGATLLAQAEPESPKGPEFGKASPLGIPLILLLLIATVLLVRNMNSHIKNLPESFDTEHPEPDQLADDGTDRAGVEGEPDAAGGAAGGSASPGSGAPGSATRGSADDPEADPRGRG